MNYNDDLEFLSKEIICNDLGSLNNNCRELKNILLYVNIRSLNSNFAKLQVFVETLEVKPLMIICSESWNLDYYQYFNMVGYKMYYNDSRLNRSDGVVIYIKVNVEETTNIELYDKLSIISTEIKLDKDRTFVISSIYRSHSLPITEFIKNLDDFLKSKRNIKNHCVVGDFNIDILGQDTITLEFLNNFQTKGYRPYFLDITRPSENNNHGTCIDNFFIKSDNLCINSFKLTQTFTDHFPLIVSLDNFELEKAKQENDTYLNYKHLKNIANNKNWEIIKTITDPNIAIEAMINEIQICINLATNSTSKYKNNAKNKRRKPWITQGIINSYKTKEMLYKIWKSNPNNENAKNDFKKYEKTLDKVTKEAKIRYEKSKIEACKQNSKQVWKYLNTKLNRKIKQDDKIKYINDDNNKKIQNEKEIADYFNVYFSTVGEKLSQNIDTGVSHNTLPTMNDKTIFLKPTSSYEINKIIKNMKDKAGGVDNISSKVLKTISDNISETLAIIFNLCIEKSIWPDALKKAEIIPIYKAGDKDKVSNYRPISLISNIAKIFEKIIYDRLYNFIIDCNIINPNQFGFVKNKGTKDALNFLMDKIYNNLDKSKPICVAFLDLAKAFDTVDHNILLDKLYNYGIRGNAYDLIKNYLSDRKQIVKFQNTKSESRTITTGVPQGTILGPLFFIIYVNDLLNSLPPGSILSYADDTAVISAEKSWEETQKELNRLLKFISEWLNANKLSLNVTKTIYMPFGNYCDSVPQELNIKICDKNISRVDNYKYLGIILDCNVKWDKHIANIIKKTKYLTFVFYKLAKEMDTKTLLTIYYSLFNSVINYGVIAWGGLYKNSSRPLQVIQNKILKTIYKNKFVNDRPLNLEQLFIYESLCYHYEELKELFTKHVGNTRKRLIQMPKITKTVSNKNSYIVAIRTFNSLPNELKNLEFNKQTIKRKLKTWIIANR